MNQQDFNKAFELFALGVVNIRGEVEWKNKHNRQVFVYFPTNSPNHVILRRYYENGNKEWEEEYQDGKLHGKEIGWLSNGCKWHGAEYQNGEQIS